MKRILIVLLSLLLVIPYSSFAENPISVILDGKKQNYNQAPTIQNGSTLVPLRGIFESLGAEVKWDGKTRTVTANKGEINITLQIGSKTPVVNGVTKSISVPAQIINGSTFVPLRFVSEAFGADVKWDGTARSITIVSIGATYDVVLNFPADKYPKTAAHIKSAIAKGKSTICTIDRDGADDNRDESLAGIATKDGYDRDEFPMAMCAEGGKGADVAYVESSDNRGSGSWVGNQLEKYQDGTRVLFVIDGGLDIKPTPATKPASSKPSVDLPKTDYNCSDFKTQAEAQVVFEAAGGLKGLDPYKLDNDGDKTVCESLK